MLSLIDRLKRIARREGIPESDLILEEAKYFLKEHGRHGYEIQEMYDSDEKLFGIDLESFDYSSNPTYSLVYSRNPSEETINRIKAEKERREKN